MFARKTTLDEKFTSKTEAFSIVNITMEEIVIPFFYADKMAFTNVEIFF